jgi:hypothetical protein
MYNNTGIYRLKSTSYTCTFYTLGINLIEYVNGIYNFMTDNYCCFYYSGARGDKVTLELDTNKRRLHLFINNVIEQPCITIVLLPCCFLIVSVGRVDRIEFKSFLHSFDWTYSVDFEDKSKNIK